MTLEQFQQKALSQFTKEITDIFFCYIENDKELMQDYLRVIGRENTLDNTNMDLGAAVKAWFALENGAVNSNPKSKLIRSYTEHLRS
jgi:hypothetical protein